MTPALPTRVWTVDPDTVHPEQLYDAVQTLQEGGLVAFPTETVYGLGADALNPNAVRRVFTAKGRPQDNPLIIHVADECMARRFVPQEAEWSITKRLGAVFWPGPLTVVVSRADSIDPVVTAGLDSVALRVPDHPVALHLIRLLNRPVAAPSANRSGRPSPTLPEHVLADLSGRIDGIVSAGPCRVGVESTVIDVTQWPPVLLRPGGVTPAQLEAVLGVPLVIHSGAYAINAAEDGDSEGIIPSPGMRYTHYAPTTPLALLEDEEATAEVLLARAQTAAARGKRVALLVTEQTASSVGQFPHFVLGSKDAPEVIAANLFAMLRRIDEKGYDLIIVQGIEPIGVGLAVMNRLRRAAAPQHTTTKP